MKYLKKFNENSTWPNKQASKGFILKAFYEEYKDLFRTDDSEGENDYSNSELLSMIGDLTIEFDVSKSDIEFVLNNLDTSFDVNKLLKITLDEWDKHVEKTWDDIYKEFKSTDKEESITNFLKFLDSNYHVPKNK